MITVEKAIKDNKTKTATGSTGSTKNNTKKYLVWGLGLAIVGYLGFKMLKGNKNDSSKIYTSNQ